MSQRLAQPCKPLCPLDLCLLHSRNPVKLLIEQKPYNMNTIAGWVAASAMVVAGAIYPQKTVAEGFTGEDFLTWSPEGQDNFIGTSVTMASFVATRTNQKTADCLNQWYAASETLAAERNTYIREAISRNAHYHPGAVILLVLEKACGSFKAP